MENLFKILEIPGKGLGMVANKKISRGQLLIAEKPLFVIYVTMNKKETLEKIDREVSRLSEEENKLFYSLYDAKNPSKPTARGIYETNALPLGSDSPHSGLFPIISRVNHSCRPNVHHTWNENTKMETIYANKDIETGEEIVTSYIELFHDTKTRQEMLQGNFYFTCTCSLCTVNDPVVKKKSDIRRNVIKELHERIPTVAAFYPEKALKDLDMLFKMFDEEGMNDDAAVIGSASYDYFQILYQTDPFSSKLKHWARMTIDNKTIASGKDNAIEHMRLKNQLLKYYS